MSQAQTKWRSIDRRLPLLIAGLLLAAVAVFAWATYRRVQHVLLATAGPRLQSASTAIDGMLAQSVSMFDQQLAGVASNPAVADFLQTGRRPTEVRHLLATMWSPQPAVRGRVALRRADGTVSLDTATGPAPLGSAWISQTIDTAKFTPGTVRLGPLVAVGDSIYFESVTAVGSGGKASGAASLQVGPAIVGYVSDVRLLAGADAQVVRDLIGAQSAMALGSPENGTWTDFDHRIAPPQVDVRSDRPQLFRRSDGTSGIGVATVVPGTPWTLWVEQPAAAILAPMRPLFAEIATLAAVIILAGALGGWILSRRVTRPIVSLTAEVERIAADPQAPLGIEPHGNEVMRLDDAFRRMARRVSDALSTAAAAQAVAEAQTREMRGLADELERQVEQAQTLSDELERSNERLHESVAVANLARAEAEAANGAKVEFLASMSHELRTPLNAIAGYIDLLEMEVAGPINEEQRRYLARAKRAQSLLLRRIDDMLNFAKVDRGMVTYTLSNVPLDELLSALAGMIQPLMAQRRLAFEYRSPAARLVAHADREKCEQIVLNLLSNAMKFTEPGGRVSLACARQADRVVVSVADSGVGVPADKLAIIFEPFIQVDPSLTRQRDGTGLGLAISRQLARGMGGELSAVSAPGIGSTFTLMLPLAAAGAPPTLSTSVLQELSARASSS